MQVLRRRAGDELRAAADALLRQERVAEALAADRAALEADPGYAPAQAGMGRALFRLGRHEEALAALAQALALEPDPARTVPLLRLMGRAALELYERLLEGTPDAAQVHANRGGALYYLGRIDAAVRGFERALSLDPALETARSALEEIRKSHPRPGS